MENTVYFKILKLFGNKGSKFTTEDLAKELGTSKRTIYSYFSSKDEMIEKTIDFVLNDITRSDTRILENSELSLEEKLKRYFENIPDAYNIGAILRHRDDLERYYPKLWEKVNHHLNTNWDAGIQLVEQGIKSGELEEVNTVVLRLMLNETLKKLLDYDFTSQNQVSFESGIKAMNDIILYGLMKRKDGISGQEN